MCRREQPVGLKPEISDKILKCGTKSDFPQNTKFIKCIPVKKKINFADINKQDA